MDAEIHANVVLPYRYRVVATENGGKGSLSVSNENEAILESKVFIPNAFTPNADNLNDVYKPSLFYVTGTETEYSFQIINRWGEVVFKTNNVNEGWDGKFNSDEFSPNETYVYQISAHGLDGKDHFKSGSFHLVR
jgi:gliding motility-associated-like protein